MILDVKLHTKSQANSLSINSRDVFLKYFFKHAAHDTEQHRTIRPILCVQYAIDMLLVNL